MRSRCAAFARRSSAEFPRIRSPNRSWCRSPRWLRSLSASEAGAKASDLIVWQVDVPRYALTELVTSEEAAAEPQPNGASVDVQQLGRGSDGVGTIRPARRVRCRR